MAIVIKAFSAAEVLSGNKELFNVNNLWDGQAPPDDYEHVSSLTNTKHWIDKFTKQYHTITLDRQDVSWMLKSFELGKITGSVSQLFDDEMESTLAKHSDTLENVFVRGERVSLKYGVHGVGPYNSLKKVIESCVSTCKSHTVIKSGDEDCKLYFFQWKEMIRDKEFRVFVCNNNLTAISQQFLFQINHWISSMSISNINNLVSRIVSFFETDVREKMRYMGSYVFDLVLCEDDTFHFIEPNAFGAKYPSGSALFHWITDNDQLTSDGATVEFRFVDRE